MLLQKIYVVIKCSAPLLALGLLIGCQDNSRAIKDAKFETDKPGEKTADAQPAEVRSRERYRVRPHRPAVG